PINTKLFVDRPRAPSLVTLMSGLPLVTSTTWFVTEDVEVPPTKFVTVAPLRSSNSPLLFSLLPLGDRSLGVCPVIVRFTDCTHVTGVALDAAAMQLATNPTANAAQSPLVFIRFLVLFIRFLFIVVPLLAETCAF